MSAVQEQLEKLYTLQEGFDAISKKQIPAIETKIDNIKFPEVDTSNLAKQGLNTEATNTKILEETAKESTIVAESQAIKDKIDNIKLPEIDTTELAKQGENADATNSAILEAVSAIVDTKNLYSVRFESNDDGPNTYTMVLPVVAGVVGDTIIL